MLLDKLPYYFEDVLNIDELKRLAKIRFHGTLSIHKTNNLFSSRFEHSIKVAEYAYYLSKKHNFEENVMNAFVLSALLHDVGHLPFSHILEPLYRASSLNYHEGITSLIIRRLFLKNETIKDLFHENVLQICLSILNRKKEYFALENLLYGYLSIDTIEGIQRASQPIDDIELCYNPLIILENIIIKENTILLAENAISEVLKFRNAKINLYLNYITSDKASALNAMIIRASEIGLNESNRIKELPKLNDYDVQNLMLENKSSRLILEMIINKSLYEKDTDEDSREELGSSISNNFNSFLNARVFEFDYKFNTSNIDSLPYSLLYNNSRSSFLLSDILPFLKYKRIFKEKPTIYKPSENIIKDSIDIEKLNSQNRFTWW